MGERFGAMFEAPAEQSHSTHSPETEFETAETNSTLASVERDPAPEPPQWLPSWRSFKSGESPVEDAIRSAIAEYVEAVVCDRLDELTSEGLLRPERGNEQVGEVIMAVEALVDALVSAIEELILAMIAELGADRE